MRHLAEFAIMYGNPVDRLSARSGMPAEVVAILLIVAGVLVIVFPHLIAWVVGITLIVIGAWWLFAAFEARRRTTAPPAGPRSAPPP